MRVISYGGGVQSTAMIVLAAHGKLGPVTDAIFANVGDDSEHPATLRYVREVMRPWAEARGILVHEVQRTRRDGTPVTLMGVLQSSRRSIDIPVRMANGAPGNRNCTSEFKIKVLGKWLKQHCGANTHPVTTLVGISWDEVERVGRRRNNTWEIVEYPLIDLRLSRHDCQKIIADAGLPVPGKSSCWFCPFFRPTTWARMRRDEPALFDQAVALEGDEHRRAVRCLSQADSSRDALRLVWPCGLHQVSVPLSPRGGQAVMTEQQLQAYSEMAIGDVKLGVVIDALIAEVRRLREQQGRERIARVEAIEQGNSLAQRLIEQREAALAERDEAKRNSERMRLAVDATAELLSAASAERDALKTDLRLTQGVLAAAQHRLVAWGCRDGHNEDDCPLCSAEHSLLNTREALTEARRVLRAQDECMVCKAELFRDLTVPHCFDCVVEDEHADEWDAICAAKAAVLAQEEPS